MTDIHKFKYFVMQAFIDSQYAGGTSGDIAERAANKIIERFGLEEVSVRERHYTYDIDMDSELIIHMKNHMYEVLGSDIARKSAHVIKESKSGHKKEFMLSALIFTKNGSYT